MKNHTYLYFLEFLVIGGGFGLMLTFDFGFNTQLLLLAFILASYIILGLFHHNKHHDIHPKVVLEYILISALIIALFVFINVTRI